MSLDSYKLNLENNSEVTPFTDEGSNETPLNTLFPQENPEFLESSLQDEFENNLHTSTKKENSDSALFLSNNIYYSEALAAERKRLLAKHEKERQNTETILKRNQDDIVALREVLTFTQSQIQEKAKQLTKAQLDQLKAEKEFDSYQKKKAELGLIILEYKSEKEKNKEEIEFLRNEQNKTHTLSQLLKTMETELNTSHTQFSELRKECNHLTNSLEQEKLALISTRQQLDAALKAEKELQEKNEKQTAELVRLSNIEIEKDTLDRKSTRLQKECLKLRVQLKNQQGHQESEITHIHTEKVQLEIQIKKLEQKLKEKNDAYENLSTKSESQIAELRDIINKACTTIQNNPANESSELDQVRSEKESLEAGIKDLEQKIKSKDDTLGSLQRDFQIVSQERDMLSKLLEARDDRNEAQEAQLKEKESNLKRHETRLNKYFETLNGQKHEIRKLSKEFAGELEASSMLHPLQDYLNMTEFELSKIELQLKKTPTSSLERPKLENALNKLSEQRAFLHNMISNSQRQLQQQAEKMIEFCQSEPLVAVPPLPPR